MKAVIAALALSCCCISIAHADEASRRAKVEQLLVSMHMDRLTDQMMSVAKAMSQQAIQQTPGYHQMTPEQKRITVEYQDKIFKLITDEMGWKAMEPDVADLYAKNFTDDEINAMVAFYQSPAGQAMVEKLPQITQESMALTQQRMVQLQPKLQALTKEMQQKLAEAKGSGKSAPPQPKL